MYSDIAAINLLSTATKGFQDLQELMKDIGTINKMSKGNKPFGNMMMNQQEDEFNMMEIQ
jgi:cytochrome c556